MFGDMLPSIQAAEMAVVWQARIYGPTSHHVELELQVKMSHLLSLALDKSGEVSRSNATFRGVQNVPPYLDFKVSQLMGDDRGSSVSMLGGWGR